MAKDSPGLYEQAGVERNKIGFCRLSSKLLVNLFIKFYLVPSISQVLLLVQKIQ